MMEVNNIEIKEKKKMGLKPSTSPFKFLEEVGKWVCLETILLALFLMNVYCVSPCVSPDDRAGWI